MGVILALVHYLFKHLVYVTFFLQLVRKVEFICIYLGGGEEEKKTISYRQKWGGV